MLAEEAGLTEQRRVDEVRAEEPWEEGRKARRGERAARNRDGQNGRATAENGEDGGTKERDVGRRSLKFKVK